MNEDIDYTPEGKNKIEIIKLHAEVADLKSHVRRWVGAIGGILGVVTAAVAIIVASNQLTESAGKAALAEKRLAAERAKFEADRGKFDADRAKVDFAEAKLRVEEAEKKEERTNERIREASEKLASAEARTKDAEKAFEEAQSKAGTAKSELARIQEKISEHTKLPKGQQAGSDDGASSEFFELLIRNLFAKSERPIEDGGARLFFFVLDSVQKENAKKLQIPLKKAGFSVGNVIVFTGKREETTVLRYFRDVDRAEAEKLRDVLVGLGVQEIRVSRVNDPDSAGSGRKYQLWVRKENLRKVP
jgi:hypothetical protein